MFYLDFYNYEIYVYNIMLAGINNRQKATNSKIKIIILVNFK